MSRKWLLMLVLGWPIAAGGQEPTLGVFDDKVDALLRNWSAQTKQIKTLYTEFTRTTVDPVWRANETLEGSARFMAPNRARLDIKDTESFVLTGVGEIWEFRPKLKQIKVYVLPQGWDRDLNDGPLPFLFGTDVEKSKQRYWFKVLEDTPQACHLEIKPKMQRDQENFTRATIRLSKQTYLPLALEFIEPNGNNVTYQFKQIYTNINQPKMELDPRDFQGRPIDGWNLVRQEVRDDEADNPAFRKSAGPAGAPPIPKSATQQREGAIK